MRLVEAATGLLETYEGTESLAEAERALDDLSREAPPAELELGELYDQLAEEAAEEDDFALAVRAERRALEHGCRHQTIARDMLAWYLLKDGQRDAGEELFAELRRERPEDVELLLTIGNARSDAGLEEEALGAFDEALATAKRQGDELAIRRARAERRESRRELGLVPDEDDRLAPRPRLIPEEPIRYSLAWLPRSERDAALARWPDLGDDLRDPDAYCRRIERQLRDAHADSGRRPSIAPLRVEELVAFAEGEGRDPGEASTPSRYAAELERRGATLAWPPGRNEPCWCGSGRKYKRCCGAA